MTRTDRGGAVKKFALCCCGAMFLLGIDGQRSLGLPSASTSQTAPCSAPQYRQFDFWIGDWNAFDADKPTTVAAHTKVERILGGCAIREDYRGIDGLEGESFSIYDASRKVWHQTWVTNLGNLLVIEGEFRSGAMVLSGVDKTADGKERLVRGTWTPEKDGVREIAVRSLDGGRSWQPWFDMLFRPKKK